jgi:hypothetical protein
MSKNLLLISSDPIDQVFAAEVSKKAGLNVIHVQDLMEGVRTIAEKEVAVTFIDASSQKTYETLEKALQESVGLFSDKLNPNFIHFLSNQDFDVAEYLCKSPLFGHFIYKNYQASPIEAGQHYGRIIRATLLDRAFGLSQIVDPGTKVQTVKIINSGQKTDAVEAVRSFATAAKFQDRMASIIANAVDELLLNAIYDAPVDQLGKPIYSTISRSTLLELKGNAEVQMCVSFDGKYIAVTVTDQHGSLLKSKLLTHLSKVYVNEEYKVKSSVAGAGIGLANVFLTGGSFFFASETGSKTEVTIFFQRTGNYREFRDQFRFISTQFYI